jgi:hypothetical protein
MDRCRWLIYLAFILDVASAAYPQERAFTVKDDIEMVRFNEPSGGQANAAAKSSPDGRYFAVVTSKGNLRFDEIESTVSIFASARLKTQLSATGDITPIKPMPIVTIKSFPHEEVTSAYAPVVTDLRWSADSCHLFFKGENRLGKHILYRATVSDGHVVAMTREGEDVAQYDVVGGTLAYTTLVHGSHNAQADRTSSSRINEDARDVTGLSIKEVLFPNRESSVSPYRTELKVRGIAAERFPLRTRVQLAEPDNPSTPHIFKLAPSGRMLVALLPVTKMPPEWEEYEPASGYAHMRLRSSDIARLTAPDNRIRLRKFNVINLATGVATPLIDAPYGLPLGHETPVLAAWSHDEKQVLITNTFLPLEGVSTRDRLQRRGPCAIAVVQIPSLATNCVEFDLPQRDSYGHAEHLDAVSFAGGDEITVQMKSFDPGGSSKELRYLRRHGVWHLCARSNQACDVQPAHDSSAQKSGCEALRLFVKQSLNDPPTLWATDEKTNRSALIWDPNPQFGHIGLGAVRRYQWTDESGQIWKGGLVLPVGYQPGKRYPLVIQLYYFFDYEFLTDGMMPTAFAARALASSGIMVLQMHKEEAHTFDQAEEDRHLAGMRSAIQHLSADGLIDPAKVGVAGFSITCQYVENALIKAPTLFAAATIADGTDHSYMQYHLWDYASLTLRQQDERIIGGAPVGAGLKLWLERAPGFHLDSVKTPLRIEAIGPTSLLGEWELYSSLEMEGKPVDLIYFPNGQHIHQKPLERLASQQGSVDWFRFWLQGYVDPSPPKAELYRLWSDYRSSQ